MFFRCASVYVGGKEHYKTEHERINNTVSFNIVKQNT